LDASGQGAAVENSPITGKTGAGSPRGFLTIAPFPGYRREETVKQYHLNQGKFIR
jgi:hypothetical protein